MNNENDKEWSSLLVAIPQDNVDSVKLLVPSTFPFNTIVPSQKESDPKMSFLNEKHSLLTFAAKFDSTKCAEYFINGGADINYRDDTSFAAFHYAVTHNNIDLVKFMLNCPELDRNSTNHDGFYALHIAASLGFDKIVELFLTLKIYDPDLFTDSKCYDAETALIIALRTRHDAVVNVLLDNGATPDLPSLSSSVYPLHAAVEGNDQRSIQKLLTFPIDVNCRDKDGYTPILLASQHGKVNMFDILKSAENIDINAKTNKNENILFFSVFRSFFIDSAIFESVVSTPEFDLNFVNNDGDTLLHSLSISNKVKNISFLFGFIKRFDPNIVNKKGQTPLDIAIDFRCIESLSFLLDSEAVVFTSHASMCHIAHIAANLNAPNLIDALVKRNLSVDDEDGTGVTPLMMAAMKGHSSIVRSLIGTRQVDINKANTAGQNALLIATMAKDGSMVVRVLLCHPLLNPNVENSLGETALSNTVHYNNADTAEALLESPKVDPNFAGTKGNPPPFLSAVRKGNIRIIDAFLENQETDILATDSDNNNALHYALESRDESVVEHILSLDFIDLTQKGSRGMPLKIALEMDFIAAASLIAKNAEELLSNISNEVYIIFLEFFLFNSL